MSGSKMWESTSGTRTELVKKLGLVTWGELTDEERDEAVRLEAGGLDGALFANGCAKAKVSDANAGAKRGAQ